MADYNFQIGKFYNFSTTIPSEFGENLEKVKYCGATAYEIARTLANIDIIHRRVFHHLPGLVDNPASYVYHVFEGANGSRAVMAAAWINMNSVTVVDTARISVTVEEIATADIDIIRQLLLNAGYPNIKIINL